MRELRFRAWNTKRECWTSRVELNGGYGHSLRLEGEKEDEGGYTIDNILIEQYTGVKDKDGKRIYEGDIVRIMGYGTYEVFWRSWDSSFSLKAIDTDIEEHKILMLCEDWEGDYTIIGNIHDYPELLENEDEH